MSIYGLIEISRKNFYYSKSRGYNKNKGDLECPDRVQPEM
jgi:hypothetical protein